MCMFGGGGGSSPPPPPPPAPVQEPAIEGAAVDDGHADSLTEKQKRLRAGQPAQTNDNSIIK